MNTITEHRTQLAELLTATQLMQGHPQIPERVTPPAAVVAEGSPLLEATAGSWGHRLRLTVRLVAGRGTNADMTAALDQLVAAAVPAIEQADYDVPTVGPYQELEANGATYLSTELVATVEVHQLTT